MSLKTIRYSRTKLYEEVWETPLTKLAKQYGLSDVGLRKVCVKLQIPLPGVGHWAKKEVGRAEPRPPLLDFDGPDEAESFIYGPTAEDSVLGLIDEEQYEEAQRMIAFERLEKNRINTGLRLYAPHRLIKGQKEALENRMTDKYGMLNTWSGDFPEIRVGPKNVKRAMLIMNALLKAFDSRGFKVTAKNVTVLGQTISFDLRENSNQFIHKLTPEEAKEKKEHPWRSFPRYDYVPSGKLSFRIEGHSYYPKTILSDKKSQKMEEGLNEVIVGLINEAVKLRSAELKAEEEERKRQERERIREEQEKKRREEKARIQTLETDAANFQKSHLIREYIEAVKQDAIRKQGAIQPGSELDKWLKWANNHADSLDPLVKSNPPNSGVIDS